MNNRPDAPLFATINVTTACNLDCAYCFMQPRSNEFITAGDFQRVIRELIRLHPFLINLSGGEPFLHPQICDFLRIAHDAFRHVMVLTNGTLLKPEHVNAIKDVIRKKRAFTLQVSLDSVIPQVNNLTRGRCKSVLQNIEKLTSIGAHVIVATVVTNRNMDYLEESIKRLSAYTKYFHLMTVQDIRSRAGVEAEYHFADDFQKEAPFWERMAALADNLDLKINTPLNYEGDRGCATGAPCMAAFSHLVIDPSLKVRPCDRLTDVVIGDLRKSKLSEIWHGDAAIRITQSKVPFCRLPRTELPSDLTTEKVLSKA